MKQIQKRLALFMSMVLAVSTVSIDTEAAKTPALNKTKVSVTVGKKVKLKVKNVKKNAKVTWKSSKKKVAKVTKKKTKGKAYTTVKGIKKGTATITASYKAGKVRKKLKCKVTVKKKKIPVHTGKTPTKTSSATATATVAGTSTPTATATATPTATPTPVPDEKGWVTTWGTAEEKCDVNKDTAMPKLALEGTTVRQMIKVTTTGEKIRFRLSNQYGKSDVTIKSMHIAKQVTANKSTIDTSTDTLVTVNSSEEFVIPKGQIIVTDIIDFNVSALENVAISTYFGTAPTSNITGHRGARATTYQMNGNNVSTAAFTSYKTTTSWFFLADASLWTPEGGKAVVCVGDSITDGYGTDASYLGKKPDSYTRWGDYFAKRLQANEKTKKVSVVNEGIGANSILGSYPTDAGKDRFARDLLQHDSVAYCIILFGVNDIANLQDTSKYDLLLPEYQKMVKLCHDNDIKVYGAPILPFGTSSSYTDAAEEVRQKINKWMRSDESQMDGIIDFESAVADPENPKNCLEKYTHEDGLHPYDGYEAMAKAIDLTMFE